jgi:SAM-dependent methyltransferase
MTARTLTLSRSLLGTTLPFALPIGLSAFLLFSVEPLVGRLVLPVFGGTPAVWTTTLCFFQAVLLAGYLYGHLSVTRFGRWGPPVHFALAGLGFVALVIAPVRIADLRLEGMSPSLDLLRILFVLIGLPAFVLTTTTPLVSGWFQTSRTERGGDPYWLYALSNGGSLLALLAYPLLIEPRLGLGAQRGLWTIGYAGLVVLLAVAGTRVMPALVARAQAATVAHVSVTLVATAQTTARPIDWPRRARWLLLAAIPSGLLSAVTTFIATDLVSAPLLWVVPLAIYLGSFIVAFSPRGARLIRWAVLAAPAMITLMWVPYGSAGGWPIMAILIVELVAFGTIAVALHGRLAQDRPDPVHLTEFYLILSVGGALASAFVALVAPQAFPNVWEYPILLVGALAALASVGRATPVARQPGKRTGLDFSPFVRGFRTRVGPYAIGATLLASALFVTHSAVTELAVHWLVVGGLILAVGGRPWFLAIATAFVLALATFVLQPPVEFRARSFFGVTEVLRPADGKVAILMNGTTVHGTQYTDPARRRIPGTYYGTAGPAGDIFSIEAARPATATNRVAVVGLGAGTLAAYADGRTQMTFFEIDPVVISVAEDPALFTYLGDAPNKPRVVEGDARLSLASEPSSAYDLVVLDAFSSDAIPVHLMTMEAISEELRTLEPNGIIAFHISNRYYDLSPAISAALEQLGLTTLERASRPLPTGPDSTDIASRWLVGTRDPAHLKAFRALGWVTTTPADHPFTDDYADLITYLHIGF